MLVKDCFEGLMPLLPAKFRQLLLGASVERDSLGCSDAAVYKISGAQGLGAAYLKVQLGEGVELRREREVLSWLKGKLPVPEVLGYEENDGRKYLLLSEVFGHTAAEEHCLAGKQAEKTVIVLARALRLIHSIDTSICPFPRNLEVVLCEARDRVRLGLVDTDDLEPENATRSPNEILDELVSSRPTEDLVFTHGDYCLPNIILQGGALSGFIDLGRAGVADRYADIALAIRSLRHNLGAEASEQMVELFRKEYGLPQINFEKVDYYILLDELF